SRLGHPHALRAAWTAGVSVLDLAGVRTARQVQRRKSAERAQRHHRYASTRHRRLEDWFLRDLQAYGYRQHLDRRQQSALEILGNAFGRLLYRQSVSAARKPCPGEHGSAELFPSRIDSDSR